MEFDDEGMIELFEYFSFTEDGFEFLFSDNFVLLHDLHRIQAPSIFLPHENYSGKAASPNHLYLFEVLLRDFLLFVQRDF